MASLKDMVKEAILDREADTQIAIIRAVVLDMAERGEINGGEPAAGTGRMLLQKEAAAKLGMTPGEFRSRFVKTGKIRGFPVGGKRDKYDESDVEKLKKELRKAGNG